MSVIQLHIVGFPYRKDIAGHVSEFLAEVPGHIMTLRPHQGNDHDKLAVRAFDWLGRFVGFVSQEDLPKAWGALQAVGTSRSEEWLFRQTLSTLVRFSSVRFLNMTVRLQHFIRRNPFLTGHIAVRY